jgi:phospholipase C
MTAAFLPFEPSRREPPKASRIGDVPPDEHIEVSIYLKPRAFELTAAELAADPRDAVRSRRTELHRDDIRLITDFAQDFGLTVVSVEPARRLVKLAGTAANHQAAFRTHLSYFHDGKQRFRGRSGVLHLPADVLEVVEAVLGLDTRPIAKPRLVHLRHAASMPGHLPNAVGALYDFPTSVSGTGQCIALIELGGGFNASDTQSAFQAMGLAAPTVIAVSVDGGTNKPNPDDGSDAEVALDIQVAGGVAPGARIAVYFTPNTDAGFVDAVTAAAHDTSNKPSVVSISWGSAESNWTAQSMQTMTSALQDAAGVNVSVFVAAGDNLATDGVADGKAHVDFPASSPWAIGCGGTTVTVTNQAISLETVWNDGNSGTGGGISDVYPVPQFQQNAGLRPSVNDGHAGRGVPDVAGDAAPASGYTIVVNGQMSVVGGTSAVAPLWAGLTARVNQKAATPVGFFLPFLYSNPNLLRPITQGTNRPTGSTIGYSAGPGWNACTGLGVPQGQALFTALSASATDSTAAKSTDPLSSINQIVVLMLENRSFDHMLGFLYSDSDNVSPAGHPFEGLTGRESNPDDTGKQVGVYRIGSSDRGAYFMPGADPGEGYKATNSELYGAVSPAKNAAATNQGFVTDFSYTLGWEAKEKWSILPGTTASNIMGMFTPESLPVLSGLARGFAVCDHWYSSVPTETLPNRAFACAATSQGHMDDKTTSYTAPSIFGLLTKHKINWSIYGYTSDPLTRHDFTDTSRASADHFGLFTDFKAAAAAGTLSSYVFLEPSWETAGNSQHPNYDVAKGEQLIHDVYYALRNGPKWNETLLIITYDEHGGCYDHVIPPSGAVPPDESTGEFGFDFTRFGLRVPAVLVSPLIAPGTVFRVAQGGTPIDHTSILKTVERRFGLPALTARDAAAPDLGAVLTRKTARTDDPLAGVVVPTSSGTGPAADRPSHLLQIQAEMVSRLPIPDAEGGVHHTMPMLHTTQDYLDYIRGRTEAWNRNLGR